jgi:hypothetical protein
MALVKGTLCALCGLDGTLYTQAVYDTIVPGAQGDTYLAAQNGKWGKLDKNGNLLIPFRYDTQEEAEAEIEVQFVSQWADGSAPYALATLDGEVLTPYKYWGYEAFTNGYAAVSDGTAYGFLDTQGNEVVPCRYDVVQPFGDDGFAIVYRHQDRAYNAVDATGRELWTDPVPYIKLWRAGSGLWGRGALHGTVEFWNEDGVLVIPAQYYYFTSPKGIMEGNVFCDGVAQVYTATGEEVYIDTQGNRVDKPAGWPNRGSDDFYEDLRWVRKDGLPIGGLGELEQGWGFENREGDLVVPYLYDAVGYFDNGYASVRVNGVYGMLKNPNAKDMVSPWAQEEVAAATAAGYVTADCESYQTYSITRTQFAQLAVNYLEKATGETILPAAPDTFTDTDDKDVLKAYAAGIVQGVGEGKFSPTGLLTREQLAAMLYRAMEKAGVRAEDPADLTAYRDTDEVSSWARDSLSALVSLHVMEGTGGGTLSPKASCTVEQAILLLYRAAK